MPVIAVDAEEYEELQRLKQKATLFDAFMHALLEMCDPAVEAETNHIDAYINVFRKQAAEIERLQVLAAASETYRAEVERLREVWRVDSIEKMKLAYAVKKAREYHSGQGNAQALSVILKRALEGGDVLGVPWE